MLAWQSIPGRLSRENKKFVFGQIRKGTRSADFEKSLAWLEQAGLVVKVKRAGKPKVPLAGYCSMNAFKVFALDVGLLGAMSGLDPRDVLAGNTVFAEFKGRSPSSTSAGSLQANAASCPIIGRPKTRRAKSASWFGIPQASCHRSESGGEPEIEEPERLQRRQPGSQGASHGPFRLPRAGLDAQRSALRASVSAAGGEVRFGCWFQCLPLQRERPGCLRAWCCSQAWLLGNQAEAGAMVHGSRANAAKLRHICPARAAYDNGLSAARAPFLPGRDPCRRGPCRRPSSWSSRWSSPVRR